MLGASQTALPGLGGPWWRSGAGWPVGPRRNRAAVHLLALLPHRRTRPPGAAAPSDPAPSAAGAAAAAWAGEPGPQSGGVVPGAHQVVAGAVDLRARGGRGTNKQCVGARPAPGRAVAQGQLRV